MKAPITQNRMALFFIFIIISSLCFSAAETSTATTPVNFGSGISLSKSITLEQAIASADKNTGQTILIHAKVGSVCEKKGCWLALVNEDQSIRVRFKDYGFFVPPTLVGEEIKVEGILKKTTLSLADSKHYAEDAGRDPNTITEPVVEYQMTATGLQTSP